MELPIDGTLQLTASAALHTILDEPASTFLPIGGICLVEEACYLVFRDRRDVVRCRVQPPHPNRTLRWFRQAPCPAQAGYAGLTFDPTQRRFYALANAVLGNDSTSRPSIDAYDDSLRFVERRAIDFPVKTDHPGFVAVRWASYDGRDYLFALCSTYKCRSGKAGRKPGGGRVHVFRQGPTRWEHVRRFNLPKYVLFDGFTSMDLRGDRLVAAAHNAPLLWIGQLASDNLDLLDEGAIYELPHDEEDYPLANAITSTTWLDNYTLLATTDGPTPQLLTLSLPTQS